MSSVTGPKTTTRGATIAVTDTVRNQGGGAADATVTRFYLSTNSALDATDLLLGSRELGPLNAGATSTGSTSLVIPAGLTPKSYYVIARTDDLDTLVETAENNNTRAMSLKVNP